MLQAGRGLWAAVAVCVVLSAMVIRVPAADDVPRGETVATRVRPELDPIGLHPGGFLLYPRVQLGVERVDNIFADEQDPRTDTITLLEPALELQSDWNRHALRGSVTGVAASYANNPSEDYNDYTAEARGRVDVGHDSRIEAGGRLARLHEDRGSPDDVNGIEPTRYQASSVFASTSMGFGRWRIALDAAVEWLFYKDVATTTGVINNEDRDRTEDSAGIETAYEFLPRRSLFVRARVNRRDYREERDDFGLDRDSTGSEIVTGARVDFTGVSGGEAYIGRIAQDYEDPGLPPLDATDFGATFMWNPTGLTSLAATLGREVEETTFDGASSVRVTALSVNVDHELLRNLILNGRVRASNNRYDGIPREDAYDAFEFGARYLANRYLAGIFRFTRDSRDSNLAGEDYTRNRVLFAVRGQF